MNTLPPVPERTDIPKIENEIQILEKPEIPDNKELISTEKIENFEKSKSAETILAAAESSPVEKDYLKFSELGDIPLIAIPVPVPEQTDIESSPQSPDIQETTLTTAVSQATVITNLESSVDSEYSLYNSQHSPG